MGKWLYTNLYTIFTQLGTYAFPNGKPQIDWGGGNPPVIPPCTVSKTIGTGLSSTGGDSDVAFGDPLEVSIAITDNLYIIDEDNIVVTMAGSPVAGAWNASTKKVTIAAVTGNVVINVPSMTYVSSGLVSMFDGMNRGGTAGEWADVKDNTRKLTLTNCTEASDHVEFNGTTSKAEAASGVGVNVEDTIGTIECVSEQPTQATDNATYPFCNMYVSGKRLIAVSIRNSATFGKNLGITQWLGSSDPAPTLGWALGDIDYTKAYISMSVDRAYINGVSLQRSTSSPGIVVHSNTTMQMFGYIAANTGNQSYRAGKMYCLRIYNRKLTSEEVAQNYKIDQKRFNLL